MSHLDLSNIAKLIDCPTVNITAVTQITEVREEPYRKNGQFQTPQRFFLIGLADRPKILIEEVNISAQGTTTLQLTYLQSSIGYGLLDLLKSIPELTHIREVTSSNRKWSIDYLYTS